MAGTEAVSMQVPAIRKVAVVPDTVQTDGVVEAKATAPFDGEVACKAALESAVCEPTAVKLMVSAAKATVTFCEVAVPW